MDVVSGIDQIRTTADVEAASRISDMNELGKDDFLKLFVTRLANQDPLEPVKDEQFIAQLAQFTQLEQLYNMNENLTSALTSDQLLAQSISNTMATSLIGREVRVDSGSVVLPESGSTNINYELAEGAANVRVEIKDASGSLIQIVRGDELGSGTHSVEWDGLDVNGNRAPEGAYSLSVHATDGEGNEIPSQAYFSGVVEGVRYIDGEANLLIGKAFVPLSNVIEVSQVDE